MGFNYLLVQDPSGTISRHGACRRGKYTTVVIPAGATHLMRREGLKEYIKSELIPTSKGVGCFRILWVIDCFERGELKARYVSNVLVVNRSKAANEAAKPTVEHKDGVNADDEYRVDRM
jgi:hypothetical protein